jgi:hypothetical protein
MSRYATIRSAGRCLPEIEIPNSVLRRQLAHVPDFVDKMEAGAGIRKALEEGGNKQTIAPPALEKMASFVLKQ